MTGFEAFKKFYRDRLGFEWPAGDVSSDFAIMAAEKRFLSKGQTLSSAQNKLTPSVTGLYYADKLADYEYQQHFQQTNTTQYSETAPTFPLIMLAILVDVHGISTELKTLLDLDLAFDTRNEDATLAAIRAIRSSGSTSYSGSTASQEAARNTVNALRKCIEDLTKANNL